MKQCVNCGDSGIRCRYASERKVRGVGRERQTLLAVFLVVVLLLGSGFCTPEVEVAGHWASSLLVEARLRGILEGYSDGSVRPDAAVTMAEFAALLARSVMSGFTDGGVQRARTDRLNVSSKHWGYRYLVLLQECGGLDGISGDLTADPDGAITRAEAAEILGRLVTGVVKGSNGVESRLTADFKDSLSIPSWARDSVEYLRQLGVFRGDEAGRFLPNSYMTRAQAVAVIVRSLGILGKRWDLTGRVKNLDMIGGEMRLECQGESIDVNVDWGSLAICSPEGPVGANEIELGDVVSIILNPRTGKASYVLIEE